MIGVPIIEVDVRYVNGEFLVLLSLSSIKRASILRENNGLDRLSLLLPGSLA